jgi:hypothetical protein|tara:strand:- start:330 stop:626 length:297 start_codon:yes stop_codon:yes gene_type:complete
MQKPRQGRVSLRNQLTTLDTLAIDEKFPDLDEETRWDKYADEDQINKRLENLLRKFRPLIKIEYTPKSYKQGLVGGETGLQGKRLKAANAKWNPINAP